MRAIVYPLTLTLLLIFLIAPFRGANAGDVELINLQSEIWRRFFRQTYEHERSGLLADSIALNGGDWTIRAYRRDPDQDLAMAEFTLTAHYRASLNEFLPKDFLETTGAQAVEFLFAVGRFQEIDPSLYVVAFVQQVVAPDPKGGKPLEFNIFIPFALSENAKAAQQKAEELASVGAPGRGQVDVRRLCGCNGSAMPDEVYRLLRDNVVERELLQRRLCIELCDYEFKVRVIGSLVIGTAATVVCVGITGGVGAKACVAAGAIGMGAFAAYAYGVHRLCKERCDRGFCSDIKAQSEEYYLGQWELCVREFGAADPRCRAIRQDLDTLFGYVCPR